MKLVTVLAVGLTAAIVGFFVYAAQTGQDPRELFEDAKARAKRFDMNDAMTEIQHRVGQASDDLRNEMEDVQKATESRVDEAASAVDGAIEGTPA
jgi:hypothetical protein